MHKQWLHVVVVETEEEYPDSSVFLVGRWGWTTAAARHCSSSSSSSRLRLPSPADICPHDVSTTASGAPPCSSPAAAAAAAAAAALKTLPSPRGPSSSEDIFDISTPPFSEKSIQL
ncbi:hypothetical protein ETH_00023885 [Eimeria tenella]|uniref:Uncharacterized protein n=1 Tax=Eimeria tenella TaxID=5802 RepID=U6L6Y1_EIMTE|nr:hypothetical protein ETH_00023885 [Eimeria tenella]CDJ44349.1 hypothetical protein ETH_00023885 [Eimeria tenella]|eukprot:XP_013235098.1 hypothetical protein ETH_00023885 [Eimeria tenella]